MRFYKGLFFGLAFAFITSCGGGGDGEKTSIHISQENGPTDPDPIPTPDPKPDPTPPAPVKLAMTVTAPDSLLYVQGQGDKSLYTAAGSGGIGADFDEDNYLTPYDGVPVSITGVDKSKNKINVFLNNSGDKDCTNLFSFESTSSQIKIDALKITGLTFCSVQINAYVEGQAVAPVQSSFNIVLNPTFSFYYKQVPQDKFVANVIKQSGAGTTLVDVASWIKYTKELHLDSSLEQIFAITGAQNITNLSLANTSIQNINALQFLPNLEELNISNTTVTVDSLQNLSGLQNLKKLIAQNIPLTNLTSIANNLKYIEYLDISKNSESLHDLSAVNKLKNLTILVASNNDFHQGMTVLKGLVNLTSLDLSDSNLSALTTDDSTILAGLVRLQSLNISNTNISGAVLNAYFDRVVDHMNLKKLIDINHFDRNSPGNCHYNQFSDSSIEKVTSLEYLDLRGNSCWSGDKNYAGITNLNFVAPLKNLKYLDISNNAVIELTPLNSLNLEPNNLKIADLGNHDYLLKKDYCQHQLRNSSSCNSLPSGNEVSQEYTANTTFVVPTGVTSIYVTGCSGGDGAQGGQGGEGGQAARQGAIGEDGWKAFCMKGNTCGLSDTISIYVKPMLRPNPGFYGDVGKASTIVSPNGQLFTSLEGSPSSEAPPKNYCKGGAGGLNGIGGKAGKFPFQSEHLPAAGGDGNIGKPGSDKKMTQERPIAVVPGQTLTINIGAGGEFGEGGKGLPNRGCPRDKAEQEFDHNHCGGNGTDGKPGNKGTQGYLRMRWVQ